MTQRVDSVFAERHIGPSTEDHQAMLATIGLDSVSALVDLAGRVAAAAKSVLNFIIGIIVMVYLLMSRRLLLSFWPHKLA